MRRANQKQVAPKTIKDSAVLKLSGEARDVFVGFVALRFALFILRDQLATFFVQNTESVKIKRGAAFGSHVRKKIQVLPEIT